MDAPDPVGTGAGVGVPGAQAVKIRMARTDRINRLLALIGVLRESFALVAVPVARASTLQKAGAELATYG
jgi:hypothetical protein